MLINHRQTGRLPDGIAVLAVLPLCLRNRSRQGRRTVRMCSYQFTDDTGVEITLPEKPTRVAVLFSSFAQVWELAGGKVDITVGESVERGFASQDAVLVDGGAGKTINSEALDGCSAGFRHLLCGPCRPERMWQHC